MNSVRIGKLVLLELKGKSKDEASSKLEDACKKMLAKPVVDSYSYTLTEA